MCAGAILSVVTGTRAVISIQDDRHPARTGKMAATRNVRLLGLVRSTQTDCQSAPMAPQTAQPANQTAPAMQQSAAHAPLVAGLLRQLELICRAGVSTQRPLVLRMRLLQRAQPHLRQAPNALLT